MSMNSRYPNSAGMNGNGLRPTGGGGIRPTGNHAYTNQPMQQGGQNIDIMASLRNSYGQSVAPTAGGFDWANADRQTRLTEEQRLSLESGIYGKDEDSLLKEEVMQHVGRLMHMFIKDCSYANINGRYQWYLYGVESFMRFSDHHAQPDPIRTAFVEFVKKIPKLRNDIAYKSSVLAGYNLTITYVNGGAPSAKDIESAFIVSTNNIYFMEMMNWFSSTAEGQGLYSRISQRERIAIDKLGQYKAAVAESFAYMGFENPYDELTPIPKERINQEAQPSHYQTLVDATQAYLGNTANIGFDNSNVWSDVNEMIARNQNYYNNQSNFNQTAYKPEQPVYHTQPISFDTPVKKRDDYRNITKDNQDEFRMDFLHRIPGTPYFAVNPLVWCYTSKLYTCTGRSHAPVGFEGTITVVKFDDPENLYGWDVSIISVRDIDMRHVIDNPAILLPYLEVDENNQIDINIKDVGGFLNIKKKEDFTPLPVKELAKAPTVVVNDNIIASQESHDIESSVEIVYNTLKPRSEHFFGVANACVNYKKFRVSDESVVTQVYRRMPFLVKGEGHNVKSFFDLVDTTQRTLADYIQDEELTVLINNHLRECLSRWLVECRGYGATIDDKYNYELEEDIYVAAHKFKEFAAKYDPDTLSKLMDGRGCARLLDRCRLFASSTRRKEYLNTNNDAVAEITNRNMLVIDRQMVITRVGNIHPPRGSEKNTCFTISRSASPELFALVGNAYGRASCELDGGVDFIISYEEDDSLWLFITTDFDSNVATFRKMPRKSQLVNYRF